ncbi:MAG: ABC-F family ATP-binding cassette domain-containing protein [Ruminococcaceae bacterium]|nr:ABC-F family ATP-binding cassette domain-containing protein [Oscillospiraceae bacterium]
MSIFSIKNLHIEFGDFTLLQDLDFEIYEKDRIGIVGANGSGKSTLLQALLGERENFTGEVFKNPNFTYGYMAQNSGLISDNTVEQEFMLPYRHLIEIENSIRKLEADLTQENSDLLTELYDKYNKGGGSYFRSRINSILNGLGFPQELRNIVISDLSGGQRTRLALARLLEANPDVMILDEPTNHLDLQSLQWLESFLKEYTGTLIVISHDRYFLDAVTEKTLFLHDYTGKMYKGNYSKFRMLFKAECDRTEKVTGEVYRDPRSIRVNFNVDFPGSQDVLFVNNLAYGFDGKMLFENINFEIKLKEHILIEGPNGSGKSSLLKILTNRLQADRGSFRFGEGITLAYYSQELADLHDNLTVFDEIWKHVNTGRQGADIVTQTDIRKALGAFGFSGENVFKKISTLSGGEKARVALLKITYERANLLILDEPTNHLDADTREVLEDALQRFEGTMIIVSHDRYFTEKLITRRIDMGELSNVVLPGTKTVTEKKDSENKNDYFRKKEQQSNLRKIKTQQTKLMSLIEKLDCRLKEIDEEIALPETASDYERLTALCNERQEVAEKLSQAEEEFLMIEIPSDHL